MIKTTETTCIRCQKQFTVEFPQGRIVSDEKFSLVLHILEPVKCPSCGQKHVPRLRGVEKFVWGWDAASEAEAAAAPQPERQFIIPPPGA